jgi:hypothetical protein
VTWFIVSTRQGESSLTQGDTEIYATFLPREFPFLVPSCEWAQSVCSQKSLKFPHLEKNGFCWKIVVCKIWCLPVQFSWLFKNSLFGQ